METVAFLASVAFLETFLAAALVFEAAFFDTALVATVAFFAAVLAFDAVFLATEEDFFAVDLVTVFAFEATFFADSEALLATLAAALTFFATAALRPASWSFLEPAEATFETVSIFALISFFAVTAPIPEVQLTCRFLNSPLRSLAHQSLHDGRDSSILLFTRLE